MGLAGLRILNPGDVFTLNQAADVQFNAISMSFSKQKRLKKRMDITHCISVLSA
jgi:hypothetical protein